MKLSTDPYKGVRDFYPEDMAMENQIFNIWRDVSEKYGYQEYSASILEPAELYRSKTSDEIVKEQTYTFTDRGEREVTLRPEMTPTVARMVAGRKRELVFPLRWYSIPNLFRYEQPQRGRLREHWQLNVDIFGVESLSAEVEVIQMAYDITRAYGLGDTDFEIRLNNRKLMDYVSRDVFGLDPEQAKKLSRLIDKKNKLEKSDFEKGAHELLGSKTATFLTLLNSANFEEFTGHLPQTKTEHDGLREVREVIAALEALGITNTRFDQTLMRGFDYYTGIVFEVFDKNPKNRRAVFGGGRYDDLLSLFGGDNVPAVGFGHGDVIARDLIELYGKLAGVNGTPSADIYICVVTETASAYAKELAQNIRKIGTRVAVDYSGRKIGDQVKNADKMKIPKVIIVGDDEVKSGNLKIKDMASGKETLIADKDIAKHL